MFSVSVNGGQPLKTEISLSGQHFHGLLDGKEVNGDFIKVGEKQYHFLYNGASYNVTVIGLNRDEKTMTLRINSKRYEISLKDKYDELLHKLGMDTLASKKVNEVKAPMPGMVLSILVQEGQEVKKGDALIVLEAMKMENILKSPGDGIIRKIAATKGSPVEKNQLLIQF
jgi:biotin carboxyl carrier protein